MKNNGNSFDSCFQYEAVRPDDVVHIRFKFYWKSLMFLQSSSVSKATGMNTKAFYTANIRMV